jgi:hypothetical protein
LAGQGAEVCLVARRRELLEDVAKQIHALGSGGLPGGSHYGLRDPQPGRAV